MQRADGLASFTGLRRVANLPQVEAERDIPLQAHQPLGQQRLSLMLAQLEQGLAGLFLLAGAEQGGQVAMLQQ